MKMDTDYPKGTPNVNVESSDIIEPTKEAVGYRIPTEIIDLPSKGLLYPKDSPLSSGTIELKYMTAKEEDILTTESYIKKGVVIDKFLESLIVTEGVRLDEILIGDIDAITIAARIIGYGSDYDVVVETPSGDKQQHFIDLNEITLNTLEERFIKHQGVNEFDFELPTSKVMVTFKMLTQYDQRMYQAELDKNKKAYSGQSKISSTQLKYQIKAINGNYDKREVNNFIDNGLLASDARALRKYIDEIKPGINLSVEVTDRETGETFQVDAPIGVQFFWPDAKV
jgi:hypothetical protein